MEAVMVRKELAVSPRKEPQLMTDSNQPQSDGEQPPPAPPPPIPASPAPSPPPGWAPPAPSPVPPPPMHQAPGDGSIPPGPQNAGWDVGQPWTHTYSAPPGYGVPPGSADFTNPQAAAASPRPFRLWVVLAGLWHAGCWIALIAGIASGSTEIGFFAGIGLLPLYLFWRFRYWRARRTPELNVMQNPSRPGIMGRFVQRGVNRGCGSMLVGMFYPITDAIREVLRRPIV